MVIGGGTPSQYGDASFVINQYVNVLIRILSQRRKERKD